MQRNGTSKGIDWYFYVFASNSTFVAFIVVMKNEERARSLFGILLSNKPKWKQFLICFSGFFFGYLIKDICEEYLDNRPEFSCVWYFTFVQGLVYLFMVYIQGFTLDQMMNPWKVYVKHSVFVMGSNGLKNGSSTFLNYPAQLILKSSQILPMMVMGALIPGWRKKYSAEEYASALLVVVGLILFTTNDAQTTPNFNVIGIVMSISAATMDCILSNMQQEIFTKRPETTQMEMIFCSTVVGLPFLFLQTLLTGELFNAWNSCSQHLHLHGVLVLGAVATFIAQVSLISLVAIFGAATASVLTTAREAMSLVLSCSIFTKPWTKHHWTGLLLIAMGMSLKPFFPADNQLEIEEEKEEPPLVENLVITIA